MWWDHLGQDKPAAEDHSHWANWSLAEPRQRALPGRWSWALCIQLCMACADLCALTVSPWAGRVKIYSNGLVFPCLQFILVFSREGHKTAIETALPWWSTLVLCAGREHEPGCGWWLVRALMCILITLPPPPLSLFCWCCPCSSSSLMSWYYTLFFMKHELVTVESDRGKDSSTWYLNAHSKPHFPAPSSKLCQNWLCHWRHSFSPCISPLTPSASSKRFRN